jgi:hypothetical protein
MRWLLDFQDRAAEGKTSAKGAQSNFFVGSPFMKDMFQTNRDAAG